MPIPLHERSPLRLIREAHPELESGQVAVIAAKAGVGKTALLVHVGLDALLRDVSVLHVSLRDTVEHVRAFYDEIFGASSRAGAVRDRTGALVAAERNRMIHSYRDRAFSTVHLQSNIRMLSEVAQFTPGLVLIDGLDPSNAPDYAESIANLAAQVGAPVWVTVRTASDGAVPSELTAISALVLKLTPDASTVKIAVTSSQGSTTLPGSLDAATMLVMGEDLWDDTAVLSPRPTDCTLYSGGANGSEAAFGEEAEKWAVHEVNFTFDGHKQSRDRGRYELSPRELAAGDVSLVYVSRRLNRTYSEGSLIRKVLQTLWHMVSRSQQVFVVGQIQDDGTVVGGTGWSVELARMWNKSLWVYDQEQKGWFRWDGNEWVSGLPVIESIHFTGSGTRYLTDDARAAVASLFERSFAPRTAE